jgi:hypothetical protein
MMADTWAWKESNLDDAQRQGRHLHSGLILAVCDGHACFTAWIASRAEMCAALDDYLARYRGGDGWEVGVTWHLYGREVEAVLGSGSFTAGGSLDGVDLEGVPW